MKNRISDRQWIILICFVLLIESLWLLMDMQIINIAYFNKKDSTLGLREAGHVIKAKENLKRRGANNLIWENSKENDILYYKDSVLTLSESSAKLYLKDETELQLSENTLVTLEEADDKSKSEIRLRFSKGDLKARNSRAASHIEGEDWVVNLEKGSEVVLRKDKDSYEFEVVSGKATLQTSSGTEGLTNSKILKLGNDKKIESIEKNNNLQWKEKKALRLYTFDEKAQVSLDWTGRAQSIRINKSGAEEVSQKILSEQESASVSLDLGNYKVRLEDEKGVSDTREIEVWRAPRIFLKKPLPRDRLKIGEAHEFVWTQSEGVKEYILKAGDQSHRAEQNYLPLKFDEEADVKWRVEGKDIDGNSIPSFYEDTIFIRKETLPAPKLKTPKYRIQNQNNSGRFHWLQLLLPAAQAAEKVQLVEFEWEAVVQAEHYIIEISSTPEFRNPEVIKTLKETSFLWKKKSDDKKYWWRVASGNSRKMGLFSEPEEVLPVQFVETPQEVKSSPAALPPQVEKTVVALSSPELEQPQPLKIENIWGFSWVPTFKLAHIIGEQDTKIELGGVVLLSAQLEFKNKYFTSRLRAASQTWQPVQETGATLLQSELSIPESWFFINSSSDGPSWGLGLHLSFLPERESSQTIKFKNLLVPGINYSWEDLTVFAGSSGELNEINFDYRFKKYLSQNSESIQYYLGCGINALYSWSKFGNGAQGNLNLFLGVEGF